MKSVHPYDGPFPTGASPPCPWRPSCGGPGLRQLHRPGRRPQRPPGSRSRPAVRPRPSSPCGPAPTAGRTDAGRHHRASEPPGRGRRGLIPLRAGGPHASLTVRFFDLQNQVIQMSTVAGTPIRPGSGPAPRTRPATPRPSNTNVIAWPNIRHPDRPTAPSTGPSVPTGGRRGALPLRPPVPLPENAGTVDVVFLALARITATGRPIPSASGSSRRTDDDRPSPRGPV
jgi:hypothetical protein